MAALFLAQLTALAAPSGKANPRVVIASEAGAKIASWTNYRSVSSITTARDSRSNVTNLSLEGTFGRNLSALLSYSYEHDRYFLESNGTNALLSPNDSRAVNRQWSYTVDPNGASLIRWYLETLRVNMIYHHTIGDFLKGDLVLGFENRFKYQMINRQRLYAVNASGAPVAGGGLFGRVQLAPYVIPVSNALSTRIREVPGYKYMDTHAYNVVTPTALNPRGLGGVGTPIDQPERQKAVNLSWLGAWFNGRLDTMAGMRRDHILLRDNVLNSTDNDSAKTSGLVGGVFSVTRNIGVYVNAARSFSAVPATRLQVYDNSSSEGPVASGKSMEAGLKFDVLEDRISGSVALYNNRNHGELVGANTGRLDLFNPAGINGRYTGIGSATGMYLESRGAELTVTLKPAKGWRMIFAAGTNDANTTEPSRAAILYNDQFNTIGTTVAVKSANGDLNPLLVPSVRTDPNSARIPLTNAMMSDPSSPYFAQLDPASGRIINANSLFLTTNGVATGVSGLPVSRHQLGFQAPGSGIATVIQPGDSLAPVVGKSAMFNTSYTFSSGPLNGVSVGGLLSWRGGLSFRICRYQRHPAVVLCPGTSPRRSAVWLQLDLEIQPVDLVSTERNQPDGQTDLAARKECHERHGHFGEHCRGAEGLRAHGQSAILKRMKTGLGNLTCLRRRCISGSTRRGFIKVAEAGATASPRATGACSVAFCHDNHFPAQGASPSTFTTVNTTLERILL